jgi:hypothetical protein
MTRAQPGIRQHTGHGGGSGQPGQPARQLSAKGVGAFLPRLTRAAFERYGFSAATLLTDWDAIVGSELAGCSAPERLKWPRNAEVWREPEAQAQGRPGATLVLRVDPAHALDVQYGAAQLLERVNRYFGYRAVADLRLVQGPVGQPAAAHPSRPMPTTQIAPAPADPALAAVAHDGLRAALTRMHALRATPSST